METITVIYTPEEASALLHLIDMAIKHPTLGGMAVAEVGIVLSRKIREAVQMKMQARQGVPKTNGNQTVEAAK